MSEIGMFVWAVLAHWQSYVTGGFVTASIGIYERKTGKAISWKLYAYLFLTTAGLVAMFYAWHDEHRNAQILIGEKAAVWGRLNNCQSNLETEQSKEQFLDTQNKVQQTAIVEMQRNMNTQLGILANSPTVQPQKVTVTTMPLPTLGTKERIVWAVVAVTNKPVTPVHGAIICEHGFPDGKVWGEMAGFMSSGELESNIQPINARKISVRIDRPVWEPEKPLVFVGMAAFGADPGKCTFTDIQLRAHPRMLLKKSLRPKP